MKSVYNKIMALATIGLLSACSADDADMQADDAIHEPVVLSAAIEQDTPSSRANFGTTTFGQTFSTSPKWGTSLLIGLAFSNNSTDLNTLTKINNKIKKYKVTQNAQTSVIVPFDENNTHYWSSKKTHYACGWCFPFKEDLTVDYKASISSTDVFDVLNDQTNTDKINCKDFLYAPVQSVNYPTDGTSSTINFYHQKTRVQAMLNTEKGNTSYSIKNNFTACVYQGVYYQGKFAIPTSGNFGTFTTTGTKGNITTYKSSTYGYFDCLMIPQNLRGSKIVFTTNIPGNTTITYEFKEDVILQPGKLVKLVFTMSQDKELILNTQISPWTPVQLGTVDLNFE